AEEARVWLEHLGVPRDRLMDVLPHETVAFRMIERLGMTVAASSWITTDSSQNLTAVWGPIDGADVVAALSPIPEFLKRSGLTYEQLLELFDRRYVNGGRLLSLVPTDPNDPATCDLAKLAIAGLDAHVLDRAQRFLRLWRVLDWSMVELDKAIDAFKADL